ncbi:putative disease resistance protein At4g19050 isoform X1 [Oryza sativa Japonica Group]|uniref:putative disease resistance protein At4g19050 isoform X1 n=1 Tax=Oryza sativa subsp. japonica TaxID=39947 RepID=UPI00077542A1|nr:uncharacterized protein LOC4350514 [Oryza sativa Japonica Group]
MVPSMMTTPWCSSSPHCISRPRTSPRLSSGTTTMRSTGTVPHSGVFTTPCCSCSFHVNKTTTAILLVTEELIRQWAAQGFLATTSRCKPRAVQAAHIRIKGHHASDIYQVGHAILQAFSEYSLLKLPFSPASEASKATETAAHFLIYHHLVASQLSEHEIFHEEEEEVGLKNRRWIRMTSKQQEMENQAWHLSTQLLGKEESNDPTTFILRHFLHTSSLLNLIDNILPKLPCLRVLDLSYTQLESLPPTVWCLSNLILLSLRGCRAIKSLHSVSNSGGSHPENEKHRMMNNLLYLDLTLLSINNFPNDFFQGMTKLEELMLAGCSSLVELPCSISALSSLLTLEVTGTKLTSLPSSMFAGMQKLQSLKLIDNKLLNSIPMSILEAHGLKELHIQGWHSRMQEEIKLDGHPTLNSFSLINAPHIKRLSLQGCRKLECVDLRDLGTLEDLDLSATAIKELPANIPNLPQLRRLILMGFPNQSRFPWHKLQRFPNVFCLDHYAEGHDNHYDNQVARVYVKDSRLFYSFSESTKELVQEGEFLQSFYVQIAPSTVNIRKLEDEEDKLTSMLQELAHKRSPYGDVYHRCIALEFSVMYMARSAIHQTARHVHMSTIDKYPHGLKYLLEVAKSIYVINDSFVDCLTNLSNLDELEECKLHFCHRMKHVFETTYHMWRDLPNSWDSQHKSAWASRLKSAWASQLKSLIHFYILAYTNSAIEAIGFTSLNHLHLEHCPRLESIMPRNCALPRLTTLNILFC